MNDDEKNKNIDTDEDIIEKNQFKYIKKFGGGGFGCVILAEKENENRKYAIKVIRPKNDKKLEIENVREFRGRNIVKIMQEIYDKKKNDYYLYVMEPSFIGCLKDFNKYLNESLIFKETFVEEFGDDLMRFFVMQLVNAFRTFYQGNYVHFDIKPDNILIFKNLEVKIIDFSFLKKLKPGYRDGIPGGTYGYTTPEYYKSINSHDNESLQKQDYYALGAVIYYLKYGTRLVEDNSIYDNQNKKIRNDYMDLNNITESIDKGLNRIKTEKYQDKDFSDFLCSLIQFKPYERANFESIIRNKWLNKNKKEINKILNINLADEDNIVLELRKSDFLINNTKSYRNEKFDERYNNEKDNKKYKQVRKGKFKFGRRK